MKKPRRRAGPKPSPSADAAWLSARFHGAFAESFELGRQAGAASVLDNSPEVRDRLQLIADRGGCTLEDEFVRAVTRGLNAAEGQLHPAALALPLNACPNLLAFRQHPP